MIPNYFLAKGGVQLAGPGPVVAEGNDVYGNQGDGIWIATDARALIGNADLSPGRGNKVHGNTGVGVRAAGNVVVAGNDVYGNADDGVVLTGGEARNNLVHDNASRGVVAQGPNAVVVAGNRIYHNAGDGVWAQTAATVQGNTVYGNALGVVADSLGTYGPGLIANNLVYANAQGGVLVRAANGIAAVRLINNTIYEPAADAVRVEQSRGVELRNNVLWVQAGYALNVAADSQVGFRSDFNDLYATAAGQLGFWQNTSFASLRTWRSATQGDRNSISRDPLFVSLAGADGQLGYADAARDGRDDDFHLQSLYGSDHGGSLTPVLDRTSGLPVLPAGAWTDDAAQSPAIDRGDAQDPFANEPAPNGGFVDIGAYGNTAQASKSAAQYVLVLRPDGGEFWPARQTFPVQWRSQDFSGTVNIDLVQGDADTPVLSIAAGVANTGQFLWTVPDSVTPGNDYRVRVTRNDGSGVADVSDAPLTVSGPISVYYVNDTTVEAGDWSTGPGSDFNDGFTAATPMASISAVLQAYQLSPGDVIRVDAGVYHLASNLVLDARAAGVTVEGYNDPAHPDRRAVLDRGNTAPGSYAVQVTGATGLTLKRLAVTGGQYGVYAADGAGDAGLTVTESDVYGNAEAGVYVGPGNDGARVTDNRLRANATGVYAAGRGAVVTGNTAAGNSVGISVAATSDTAEADRPVVRGNTLSANGAGVVAVNALVEGNDVSGPTGTGIQLVGGEARGNEVRGGTVGIAVNTGAARGNVVHDNDTGVLVQSRDGAVVAGNRVYHNATGVRATGAAAVQGNTVYGNAVGVLADGTGETGVGLVANNLAYANADAGIVVRAAAGTLVVNNTVYQPAGDAVRIAGSSQGVRLRDNILWAQAGYALGVAADSQRGFASDYNDLVATAAGRLGRWQGRDFAALADWVFELGLDAHSVSADPRFADPAGPDGVLGYGPGGDGGADDDFRVAAASPAVDAGDPAAAFAAEPAPNGGRVNLGHTGDTPQATASAARLVQVLAPTERAKLQAGVPTTIAWRSAGLPAGTTADVELSTDGGTTWALLAAGVALDGTGSGSLGWTPAAEAGAALVRVRAGGTEGVSAPFLVANGGHDYYVSPAGDNAASGKDAAHPMASLRALLAAYHPHAGDTVHLAAGTYPLFVNVTLDASESGVRIEGPAAGAAVLDRGNAAAGSYAVELAGATNVTLDRLAIAGGQYGVYAGDGAGSNGLAVTGSDVAGNAQGGIYIGSGNVDARVLNNQVHGNGFGNFGLTAAGVVVGGLRAVVAGNAVFGNAVGVFAAGAFSDAAADRPVVRGNAVTGNRDAGVVAQSALVEGNDVSGQTGPNAAGVLLFSGEARGNTVHGNAVGIDTFAGGGGAVIAGNRVYNNAVIGLRAYGDAVVEGNAVYGNALGVAAWAGTYGFRGEIVNNLVYANTQAGIEVRGAAPGALVAHNTVYQTVGDAGRVTANSQGIHLRDNIFWVEAGYAVRVAADSQQGFASDYNLFHHGADPNAHVGGWGGTDADTLAAWQAASGGDGHAAFGDPGFVDMDGADNVLGYTAANGGRDGGRDDNFYLTRSSPAIDRGDSWTAAAADLEGHGRADDPGTANAGSPDYAEHATADTVFGPAPAGEAQGWHADAGAWTLPLPFAFPFYGTSYSSALVSSKGFLQFGFDGDPTDGLNSTAKLRQYARIAPLWADLRTDGDGDDIFVDATSPDSVTVRWAATNKADGGKVNFAVTLFRDGRIRFDYGPGNTNLRPTVGLSVGGNAAYRLAGADGRPTLTDAPSALFTLDPGFVDVGAYEFRGSSLDATPATITGTTPAAVHAGGATGPVSRITLTFAEDVNPVDANAAGGYELRKAGTHGFGSADDVVYALTPAYSGTGFTTALDVAGSAGGLPPGSYRLTVFSSGGRSVHDLAGLLLDGDGDGTPGGDYVRFFEVAPPLTVSPASLPDGAYGSAYASQTFTAGGGTGPYTFTEAGALPGGMTFTGDGVLSGTPTQAGTFTFTVTATDANRVSGTSAPLTLVIAQAPLTVTADDRTRTYGAANPAWSVTYTGFVLGDGPAVLGGTLTVTSPATAASHAGSYPITPAGLTSPNYAIRFVSGTLSVTPAPLTVTADDKSRDYGQPNPPLTASYDGFVNGDTPASLTTPPTLSTTATPASPVGSYPIDVAGATSPDYTITFVRGTLRVNALPALAAPVITAPSGTVASPVALAWRAVAGAATYQLRIDDLTAHTEYAVWQDGLTGTGTSVTTLTPTHSFRAWLRAVNAAGAGPWASVNFAVASPLTAPVLTAPVGTVSNPPTIAWQAVAGAASYQVWITDITAHVDYAFWRSGVTATSLVADPLVPGDLYRVQVRAVDANGPGPWAANLFYVAPSLAAPQVTAPTGTVVNPVTVSWQAVSGAASYQVWVTDLTAHVDYAFFRAGITATSTAVDPLVPDHLYRVLARAVDAGGQLGPWSAGTLFSVASALAAPVINNPSGNPPTITWQAVAGAASYNLLIDDLTAGQNYFVYQAGLTGTSYTATTLVAGHACRVWVQAVDAGGSGPWSTLNLTAGAPAAPVITSPAGSASNPPTITWQSVTDAVSYTLRVDDLTAGANYVFFQAGLTGTSFTIPGLTSGHTYRVWLRAVNAFGGSPYGDPVVITVT